jgi:hypothetical protein
MQRSDHRERSATMKRFALRSALIRLRNPD